MSKEILVVLNRKRGSVKAQLPRIKNFINNPDEKDKIKLELKMDTLKSLRIKLSDIRNEYYEVVTNESDLEPLELEILDLEDDCEDIQSHSHKEISNFYNRKDIRSSWTYWTCNNKGQNFLQSLRQLKLDWNDPLPSNLVSYWKSFKDALESINCLNIPRYCLQDKSIRTELHGFPDSSEKAYGAALYLRCIDSSGQIFVGLLCSKSKYKELEPYDTTAVERDDLFLQELKETSDIPLCALLKTFEPLDIISNCSSFTKLQRVIAWCKRFIEKARHPRSQTMGPLKSTELSESLKCIIKNIQRTSFSNEIQYLEKGIPLPNSCKLLNLHPFLDNSGLLRVGGRLRNSPIPRNQKHPMIIPTNHNFTYLVINNFHILYFHTGAEALP
ncbi:integrase catalytic domain-containing protein [Trichonephila clavata]|uniref:Integrase catalytic domain-containing protein n=1 Tax=Trichonephila clavata TaxID=2740835 RepID=A0A8X6M573_TRICU|nr:integrase catalytic domain-containing protein [Trichonephila clavata]